MANPLIRTLNGWRFERPLALVLGASAAFATIAMPHALFGQLPGVTASGFERPIQVVVAMLVAVIAAAAGYAAMKRPTVRWAAEVPDEDEDETPAIDIPVRLRRADAHPDFPPREPIRASRDLGMPFMNIRSTPTQAAPRPIRPGDVVEGDVVELADPLPADDAPTDTQAAPADAPIVPLATPTADDAIPPADMEALDAGMVPPTYDPLADAAGAAQVPAAELIAAAAADPHADAAAPIVADAPAAPAAVDGDLPGDGTPDAETPRRETLAEMMARLSAGIEARAGKPVTPPPADMLAGVLSRPSDTAPDMREALEELNRLAGRRR